MTEGVCTL